MILLVLQDETTDNAIVYGQIYLEESTNRKDKDKLIHFKFYL